MYTQQKNKFLISMERIFIMCFVLLFFAIGACTAVEKKSLEGKEGVFAIINTPRGDIVVELFYEQTPLTVTNFVGLAEGSLNAAKGKPFYDGLNFHRVISKGNGDKDDFMIQGGDPRGNGSGGPGYQFSDEFVSTLKHDKPGKLSMANSGPGTNGSQFFITIVPTPWLDNHHTIFGQVIEGIDVVNKIKQKDAITKITIVRQGASAEQFKATQQEWDALNEAAKKNAAQAAAGAQKKDAELAASRSGSLDAAKKFLPNASTTADGILYSVTKQGSGAVIGKGKTVQTHYTGYFLNGEKFDSSIGGSPLQFVTAAGQMIPGFDKMVQEMKAGEKRTIILPPAKAYGSRGTPGGEIPPNAFICFDVEVVSVK